MKILFAGDFHGNWGEIAGPLDYYLSENPDIGFVMQAGDFGFWPWPDQGDEWPLLSRLRGMDRINNILVNRNVTLLFADGNHENHTELAKLEKGNFGNSVMSNIEHMPRGSIFNVEGGPAIAFFGGGTSLDRQHRTEGVSWWKQEAPNYADLATLAESVQRLRVEYGGKNIDAVVSHEVPIIAGPRYDEGHHGANNGFPKIDCDIADALRNGIMMDAYDLTLPAFWFYGHHHQHRVETIIEETALGRTFETTFVGLNRDTESWDEIFWVQEFGANEGEGE